MSELYTAEELANERKRAKLPAVIQLLDHIDIREKQLDIALAALNDILMDNGFSYSGMIAADALAQAVAAIRERVDRAAFAKWHFDVIQRSSGLVEYDVVEGDDDDANSMAMAYEPRVASFMSHAPADIRLLLDALAAAEARAARYRAQRDEALRIADGLDKALEAEGVDDVIAQSKLSILHGLFDIADGRVREVRSAADILADAAQPVDEPTDAQVSDALDARRTHEAGYDASGYDEDEG